MTPSGFSIGMILKMYFLRSSAASKELLVKKFKIPSIMNEALDSPGWTLAVIIIACLLLISSKLPGFVIVK